MLIWRVEFTVLGKKYFLKNFTSLCISSWRNSGMGFPYSQLSAHLQETLIPCDFLGLGGNNHGCFCATLAMTKPPCLCTLRAPCQPSCRLRLINSLGARGNTQPPGPKPNDSKKPTAPAKQPVCCPRDTAHKIPVKRPINATAVIKAVFLLEKKSHACKS